MGRTPEIFDFYVADLRSGRAIFCFYIIFYNSSVVNAPMEIEDIAVGICRMVLVVTGGLISGGPSQFSREQKNTARTVAMATD